MSPRPAVFLAILAAALSWVVCDASGPMNGSAVGHLARLLGCLVWTLLWLSRGVLWLVARVRRRPERASGAGLLLELGLVASAALLVHLAVPMKLRFALSEPALTRYAEAVQRDEKPAASWVGLYPVQNVERMDGGGIQFTVEYGIFGAAGSFVYASVPPQSDSVFVEFTPLRPRWYARYDAE